MNQKKPYEEPVLRAIRALKEARTPDEKCYFCGGTISIVGSPPGGPYTAYHFTCPCKKTSGYLRGI